MADGGEIGRMIEGIRQGMRDDGVGREHVRGVGFQQDAVMRELAEDFENGGFSWMEEVAGEGKIRAEGDQAAGDLDGTVERVK